MTDTGNSGPADQGYWGSQPAPPPRPPAAAAAGQGYWGVQPAPPTASPVPANPATAGWTPAWMTQPAAAAPVARPAVQTELAIDGVGAAIIGVGLLLLILALTALDWFRNIGVFGLDPSVTFGTIRQYTSLATSDGTGGLSIAYFNWLAYVLVALTVLTALVAKLTGTRIAVLIAGNLLLALAGTILTAVAFIDGGPVSNMFSHSGPGFWCAFVGFLVVGVGTLHNNS